MRDWELALTVVQVARKFGSFYFEIYINKPLYSKKYSDRNVKIEK